MTEAAQIFTPTRLDEIFPQTRTDDFFSALYGDTEDGAYDIRLRFVGQEDAELRFDFQLLERPGMCLACNLTYGLPQVFARHPILAVGKLTETLCALLEKKCAAWTLGATQKVARSMYAIPLRITSV